MSDNEKQGSRQTSALEGQRHEIGNSVLFEQNAVEAGMLTRTASVEKMKDHLTSKTKIEKKPSSNMNEFNDLNEDK